MIDLKAFKKNPKKIAEEILKKDPSFNTEKLLLLFKEYNETKHKASQLQEKINKLSKYSKTESKNLNEKKKDEVKEIKVKLNALKEKFIEVEKNFYDIALSCPNILDQDVQRGGKEDNHVIRTFGKKPSFSFSIKNHLDLLKIYNPESLEFSNQITKSGFFVYEDKLAWLIYRLAMICLKHNESYGFKVIHIPQLANTETLQNAGNLPRFKDEIFFLKSENLGLIPTAEISLSAYCKNKKIKKDELPIRLTSWTRCYRQEIGGYGTQERGLIRIHEFEKIEIFSFTSEENSKKEHEYMIKCVESLLQKFNLHYQVVLLAAEDTSFTASKTYDIELWLPGQESYKETSSIGNCQDFQTRRSQSKYYEKNNSTLLHSLNGSSLALSRLMVALLETWQQKDGTINFDGLFKLLEKIEKTI